MRLEGSRIGPQANKPQCGKAAVRTAAAEQAVKHSGDEHDCQNSLSLDLMILGCCLRFGSSRPHQPSISQAKSTLAHSCIAVSGSVSLELMSRLKPAMIMYRDRSPIGGLLKWLVFRLVVKVKYITLVNLLAGEELYPEFATLRDSSGAMADQIVRLAEASRRDGRARGAVANGLGRGGRSWGLRSGRQFPFGLDSENRRGSYRGLVRVMKREQSRRALSMRER
jgi:hypothetical protein